jgi:hypothetical protein
VRTAVVTFFPKIGKKLIFLRVKMAQLCCVPRVLLIRSRLDVAKAISSAKYDLLYEGGGSRKVFDPIAMIPVLGPTQEMAMAMLVWSCLRSPAV